MIHISLRNKLQRETIQKELESKKYVYRSYVFGMGNNELYKLREGDIIIGYLGFLQLFVIPVDIDLYSPNSDGSYKQYLITAIDIDGKMKNCVVYMGEVKDI